MSRVGPEFEQPGLPPPAHSYTSSATSNGLRQRRLNHEKPLRRRDRFGPYRMASGVVERFHTLRVRYRDYLAEFFGTLVLIFFGNGVGATVTLFPLASETAAWVLVSFGWGFALTMGIFVAGGVSGGHLNPAITTTAFLLRGFPFRKVPGYILMQFLGAFCGAGLIFGLFKPSLDDFDGGDRQVTGPQGTAKIFATYPQPYMTVGWAFLSECYCTAALVVCIYAILDEKNMPGTRYAPIAIGLVVTTISMCIGFQTGFAINPARDLGPRLLSLAASYGPETFTAFDHYAWVPAVAPFLGALVGGLCYDFFINHPRDAGNWTTEEEEVVENY
ncbi:glycerol channel [Dimargaris xerosporica]|nr:glycerol channel [Dimargaris xerosporica]